ncbi:MAG: lytic transglycosylase domain-containing protein [Prevotella sp.]|nr:lytic transglycosylase domain-containing protein [Prevotella sp.]
MKKFITFAVVLAIGLVGVWLLLFNVCFPLKYRQEILAATETYQVDPVLIASVINAESSFDKNKVSSKQAVGLMQLLPATAAAITTEKNIDLFDPATNISLGVKYLAYLINRFDDVDTALFAYNAGEGNVARWLAEQGKTKLTSCPFKATNAYVHKIKNSLKYYRGRI